MIEKQFIKYCIFCIVLFTSVLHCSNNQTRNSTIDHKVIQGVRFDPSYYYNLKKPLPKFIDSAFAFWKSNGINTIFFKAYDPYYGASYRTNYKYNKETDYGRKDLMKLCIETAHRQGMRMVAWIPAFDHKGVWDKQQSWRLKSQDGSDYIPFPNVNYLCVRNPQYQVWWRGFLSDIIKHYPELDGIDIAEPSVIWKKGEVCHCAQCSADLGKNDEEVHTISSIQKRADKMSDLLLESFRIIHDNSMKASLTIIPTVDRSSNLVTNENQIKTNGIDLNHILDREDRPDWVSMEFLWQQWANTYEDPATFTPDWVQKISGQGLSQIAGRAQMVAHVEITPIGPVNVSPQELARSIVAAQLSGVQSIEFYDTHITDSLNAWPVVKEAWENKSNRKAIVLFDSNGLGAANQVATLLGHFSLSTIVLPIDSFSTNLLSPNAVVVYVGTVEKKPLPKNFIQWVRSETFNDSLNAQNHTAVTLIWINYNIEQVLANTDSIDQKKSSCVLEKSLTYRGIEHSRRFTTIEYKSRSLYKIDSSLVLIDIIDTTAVKVYARAKTKDNTFVPYIIKSGQFWYVADCPVDFITEGGRDLAFADLLHDMVNEHHDNRHTGLVRIEDVCPLSDPANIRKIADLLGSKHIPFSIALVPYYIDPEENIAMSLSEKPELVKAIHYAISKGAAIVQHGTTHQYRGRTTFDYEYWDPINGGSLFRDSKEYVRIRIQKGLDELHKNGIYPVAWETPHYAASQLDYSVIDQFYSTEYGRRQVINKTGYDQLVPYLIAHHPSGNQIIPENLGYIPNDNQNASQMLNFSENNLVVRDGFASFFFHPWIKLSVLKDLVNGIEKQGYNFADIRTIPMNINGTNFEQITGNRNIQLKVQDQNVHTFYLDKSGRHRNEWTSEEPFTGTFSKTIQCPSGWMFVAESFTKEKNWFSFSFPQLSFLQKIKKKIITVPDLTLDGTNPARACILWSNIGDLDSSNFTSQFALRNAFSSYGMDIDTINVLQFLSIPDQYNCIIVPNISAQDLSTQQVLILADEVAKGRHIILEKFSPLAQRLGLDTTGENFAVNSVRDEYFPSVPIKWNPPDTCEGFDANLEYVTQYSTTDDKPVVISGEYGIGSYIYFGTSFSAPDDTFPSRFPFFLDLLEREFSISPTVRSNTAEVFFDPAIREDVKIEDLVKFWHCNGVKTVYVSGWQEFTDYSFEYPYFIDLLHQTGIKAYAWFDLPYISDRFWYKHPSWREKTAALTDAAIGWRKLMNFTNDTCRQGALLAVKNMLMLAPWDGAILTGQIFEGTDPSKPQSITPMNESFRAQYKQDRGYDPVDLFNPDSKNYALRNAIRWNEFLNYRDSIEIELTSNIVSFFKQQLPVQTGESEFILTRQLTDISDRARVFYDSIVRYDQSVKLQAEIPSTIVLTPVSMHKLTTRLKGMYKGWKPMFAINFDNQKQLWGMAFMNCIAEASRSSTRLSLQTEGNIYEVDFKCLPYALAALSNEIFTVNKLNYSSLVPLSVNLDRKKVPLILIDGNLWPASNAGTMVLPQGKHQIEACPRLDSWFMRYFSPIVVTGFTGSFTSGKSVLGGLQLAYKSDGSSVLNLSNKPSKITVDGIPLDLTIAKVKNENTAYSLPGGSHLVKIHSGPLTSSFVRFASLIISVIIVCGSSIAVAIFIVLYASGRFRRLLHRRS